MTATYGDSRRYQAPRDRIFQACHDAMQPCGFSIISSDQQAGTIEAVSSDGQFSHRPDAGFWEEVSLLLFKPWLTKFREGITVSVDDDGWVHAGSTSQPSTVIIDQGKNRQNIIRIWEKLDEYLLRSPGVVIDSSVTITGNAGPIQNASPGGRQNVHHGVASLDQETAADILTILESSLLWKSTAERWERIEKILVEMQAALTSSDTSAFRRAAADLAFAGSSNKTRIGDVPTVPPPPKVRNRVDQMIHSLGGDQ